MGQGACCAVACVGGSSTGGIWCVGCPVTDAAEEPLYVITLSPFSRHLLATHRRRPRTSWDQEDLADRLAMLERRLRFGRLRQWVLAEDVDLQLAAPDPAKDVARPLLELWARRRVRAEIHPGEVEAAFGAEQAGVDRPIGPLACP